jgi:hypothetical protein
MQWEVYEKRYAGVARFTQWKQSYFGVRVSGIFGATSIVGIVHSAIPVDLAFNPLQRGKPFIPFE